MLSPHGRGVEIHRNCLSRPNKEEKVEIKVEIKEENMKIEIMKGNSHSGPSQFFLQGLRAAETGGRGPLVPLRVEKNKNQLIIVATSI